MSSHFLPSSEVSFVGNLVRVFSLLFVSRVSTVYVASLFPSRAFPLPVVLFEFWS